MRHLHFWFFAAAFACGAAACSSSGSTDETQDSSASQGDNTSPGASDGGTPAGTDTGTEGAEGTPTGEGNEGAVVPEGAEGGEGPEGAEGVEGSEGGEGPEGGEDPDGGAGGQEGTEGGEAPDGGDGGESGDAGPGKPLTASQCFKDIAGDTSDPANAGPNYDQFHPVVGSHCLGTNHQEITGIEKVVFLGDSITTGTPPSLPAEIYRNVLIGMLQEKFGPDIEILNCAKFGDRTDDLLQREESPQIPTCFPPESLPEQKRTLVVMTLGGNDFAAMAQDGAAGAPLEQIYAMLDDAVLLMRQGIEWFYDDPNKFPNGVFVLFANNYEFTDGTGDMASCPLAGSVMGDSWPEGRGPAIKFNEEYMRIAVETQTDMIFMLEHFCGHGYHRDDPEGQCYRGPKAELWFDATCIHPNPAGHKEIANMFMAVVNE